MNLRDCRLKFRIESEFVPTVRMHFKSDNVNTMNLWRCYNCSRVDTIAHIKFCDSYADLRSGLDLDNDQHLVNYFRDVIKRREQAQM